MVVLVAGSVAGSLGPAPRFSACKGHLRSVVHVLVLVELELERDLRATHAKKLTRTIVGYIYCKSWV